MAYPMEMAMAVPRPMDLEEVECNDSLAMAEQAADLKLCSPRNSYIVAISMSLAQEELPLQGEKLLVRPRVQKDLCMRFFLCRQWRHRLQNPAVLEPSCPSYVP